MSRPRRLASPPLPTIQTLERGETREMKVFGRRRTEVDVDHLKATLVGPVEALIRTTCTWGDLGDDWDLGDYRFLIFDFAVGDALLYVQFWSEPQEAVLFEASSGVPNPPKWQLVGAVQRKKLRRLGFHKHGKSGNYEKEIVLTSHHFRAVADEAVHVLVDVFGYRGLEPLRAKLHADSRAETARVHSSVTPEELQKIMASLHLDTSEVMVLGEAPAIEVNADGVSLAIALYDDVSRQNLYQQLLVRRPDGAVASVDLHGGVTTEYLRRQLRKLVDEAVAASPASPEASGAVH
ncbi:MAG TPA: hypothetical protein VMF13_02995 [Luteitalea sp.]|nr:hypothetical protein [Luteitalea sp.]